MNMIGKEVKKKTSLEGEMRKKIMNSLAEVYGQWTKPLPIPTSPLRKTPNHHVKPLACRSLGRRKKLLWTPKVKKDGCCST